MNLVKDFSIRKNNNNEILIAFEKINFHEKDFFEVLSGINYYIKNSLLHIEYIDINNEILDSVIIDNLENKTIFKLKKQKILHFMEIGEENKIYSAFLK